MTMCIQQTLYIYNVHCAALTVWGLRNRFHLFWKLQ